MILKRVLNGVLLIISIIIVGLVVHKIYLYIYVLQDASEYPSGAKDNMVIYSINSETILASIDHENANIFMPALKNPIYDEDVELLWTPGSLAWGSEDYLKVADVLHQATWNEHLKNWKLYSASYDLFQCADVTRIDNAAFGFYQRKGNWYFLVHNMTIDLGYGLVYAGDDNGYYTGKWKDIDLDKAIIDKADKALLIAEQNGGKETRLSLVGSHDCSINIFLAPFVLNKKNWGWKVTYSSGEESVYEMIIEPYTGKFDILNSGQ